MRECIRFKWDEVVPADSEILKSQGMPDRAALSARNAGLLDGAMLLLERLSEPKGVLADIETRDFASVHRGEGLNAGETLVDGIYLRAEAMALFAATLGEPVDMKIRDLFREGEWALGYMLDAAASAGADRLATRMGERFLQRLTAECRISGDTRVLPYSPGYCGWHITAQAKLFEFLRPEPAGITLSPSYLMQPLKSVSGVLIAGKAEIHRLRPSFSFCKDCAAHPCRERLASALRD